MSDLPPEIDTGRPHPARVYDALIGGTNNFAADRETVARVLQKSPNARIAPRENRAFLGRAVRFLTAEAGLRQFLDIGTGLPTANTSGCCTCWPTRTSRPRSWPRACSAGRGAGVGVAADGRLAPSGAGRGE